jgi:hypothetical protein
MSEEKSSNKLSQEEIEQLQFLMYVGKNMAYMKDYASQLMNLIEDIENNDRKHELQKECEEYKNMSIEEHSKRALYSKEWIFEDYHKCFHRNDLLCISHGDVGGCWFDCNYDNMKEFKGYHRFKGTNIRLCNKCYDNRRLDSLIFHKMSVVGKSSQNDGTSQDAKPLSEVMKKINLLMYKKKPFSDDYLYNH